MAMAAVQYPQAVTVPETHDTPQSIKLSRYNPSAALSSFDYSSSPYFNYSDPQSLVRAGTPQSIRDDPNMSVSSLAASAAARNTSDPHYPSKLQKRPSAGSAKSESKPRSQRGTISAHPPSIASYDQPFPALKQSSSKTVAKDRFKMNLRKLAQQKRDDDQPTLDLSKTLEENEQRSGLGISVKDVSAHSFSQLSSPLAPQSHSRNISYTSQYSGSSMSFKPSTPFSFANRPPALPSTPSPEPVSYSTSVMGSNDDQYGTSYISGFVAPESIPSSPQAKTFPRINTAGSANSTSRFAPVDSSQSIITSNSLSRSARRPRGNTNQSLDTVSTPKSYNSLDRAFSFITRSSTMDRSETMDSRTRAASIHAARQAFEEHENAKAEKQERREQKAAEKAEKRKNQLDTKRRKHGLGPKRLGLRTRSRSRSTTRPMEQVQEAQGMAYTSMPTGPKPTKGEKALPAKQKVAARPKRSGLKTKYLRFVSWVRTKFLRFGRQRRRAS